MAVQLHQRFAFEVHRLAVGDDRDIDAGNRGIRSPLRSHAWRRIDWRPGKLIVAFVGNDLRCQSGTQSNEQTKPNGE